jgi:DNA (cytosine-5)-methyltransferase 1
MDKEAYNAGAKQSGGLGIQTENRTPALRACGTPAIAYGFKAGKSADGGLGDEREVAPTVAAQPSALEPTVAIGLDLYNQAETGGVAMTIRAAAGNPDTTPCVAFENNHLVGEDCARTLSGDHESRVTDTGQSIVTRSPCCAFDANLSQNPVYDDDAADTLAVCHKVATAIRTAQTGANGCGISDEAARTLDRAEGQAVAAPGGEYVVRRLTPRECERLQGFPDDWTRIPYRGKPAEECPDGPRYKAMGNSWGTNCAEWILRRILAARPVWHRDGQDD